MTVRTLLALAFSIPVFALLANSVVVGLQQQAVKRVTAAVEAREVAYQAIAMANDLRAEIERGTSDERLRTRLVYWKELRVLSDRTIATVPDLGATENEIARLIADHKSARDSWLAYRDDSNEETQLFLDHALTDLADTLSVVSTSLRTQLIDAVAKERNFRNWPIRFGLTMSLLTAFLAGAFAVWFSNRTTHFVRDLVDALEQIAAGDLKVRIRRVGLIDFSNLSVSFESMTTHLAEVVTRTRESQQSISETATAVEEAVESAALETKRQEAAVEQTTRSVLALGSTIREVAADSLALRDSADSTSRFVAGVDRDVAEIAERTTELHVEVESIEDAVGHLEQSMKQVADISSTMEGGARQIDDSLGRCREIIEQVASRSISNVGYAVEVTESAQVGVEAMAETERGMRSIEDIFRQVEAAIRSLYERSESIDRIVAVIGSLADETKLLSLNATIIAAQSGTHGQAFAVVAGQVSQLAERSAGSAEAIAELISDVRSEINNAVAASTEGATRVTEGSRLSESARSRLGEIAERAERSQNQSRLIVEASDEGREALRAVGLQSQQTLELADNLDKSTSQQLLTAQEIREALRRASRLGQAVQSTTEAQSVEGRVIGEAIDQLLEHSQRISEAMAQQASEVSHIEAAAELSSQLSKERLASLDAPRESVLGLVASAESLDKAVEHFSIDNKESETSAITHD